MEMDAPPVLRCGNWDELIAAVAARPGFAALAGIEPALARAVLAAPTALATWIARRMPHAAGRGRLKVLVIGAEMVDAVDQGRWYAALPVLLGGGARADVTLVGAELDPSFASPAGALAPGEPARCVRARLAEFLAAEGGIEFDLAIMFHPGLGRHRGWLADGSFTRLISGGVELVASAYEEDEAEMDGWVAESYGFGVAGDPVLSPFFLDLDHERTEVRWGRALWGFSDLVPAAGQVPDGERLAALDTLTRMAMHSVTEVGVPGPDPGAPVEMQAQTGACIELIHVFDNRFADPATRSLLRLTPEGGLEMCGRLSEAELAAYPGRGGRALARAMWAARIKAGRLLQTYPPSADRVTPEEKARELVTTLRSRAAKLFGKN
jgi:hypothetical protein